MKTHSPVSLGTIGLITAVILDLIGIVGLLVLTANRGSSFAVWAIAGIAGLISGAIIGAYSSSEHLVITACASGLLAAGFLGLSLWIALDITEIGVQLGRLYFWATAFQVAGTVIGALAGHFGRPAARNAAGDADEVATGAEETRPSLE